MTVVAMGAIAPAAQSKARNAQSGFCFHHLQLWRKGYKNKKQNQYVHKPSLWLLPSDEPIM